jgi:hypothetical protein
MRPSRDINRGVMPPPLLTNDYKRDVEAGFTEVI